ncbi:hypothetical protein IFM89_004825 [Coptis chinensis]|uniref:non-specific serine/threonine protein kinase n=1 Tax=Coptis chinensis TaxID=261450 RepID=A0A835LLE6_9MAGN|nr:hypothetical protein IFM89_004825 [Coptis chinensis]
MFFYPSSSFSQPVPRSAQESKQNSGCNFFPCENLISEGIGFPFSNTTNPECGLWVMNCSEPQPKVKFHEQGKWYPVNYIDYGGRAISILDQDVQTQLESGRCDSLDFTVQASPSLSINVTNTSPLFKCKRENSPVPPNSFLDMFPNHIICGDYELYFDLDTEKVLPPLPETLHNICSVVHPRTKIPGIDLAGIDLGLLKFNLTLLWNANFRISWNITPDCSKCHDKRGRCLSNPNGTFLCDKTKGGSKKTTKVLIGVGTGIGGVLLTCIIFILYKRHKRNKLASSSALISRDISRDLSSKPDLEKGSTYFQTPIFTYKELDEATNHFDSSKELGDGGFGTVYHGKLRDGRVVAVKRLFEHNYKRVDQFLNEIQILSRLRHQNLVSLYGCTNRHSRELLLVYEYVPNGTVADHLHGDRAKDGLLTWPVRMTIAIESADALAYLHASDIIHRDVKTNNILLDTAFHVKVADFGLSRLFPTDVTHVSTAPQGTPGYVDPEYYQCYQLNDRSDVYSFGVVLIELISSKPAVDIGRHRHEINLANMAINRIHNRALHELVDPSLGFNSDFAVRNMITLVAELAFRCLQQEKEMRPCMVEVLEILRGIGSEEYKKKTTEEMDISADARLLKNSLPLSPDSVTDKWVSKSTTPNTSG